MSIVSSVLPIPQTSTDRGRWRLSWARSLAEVDALESAWRELGMEIGHPLAQFSWGRAALSAYAGRATPQVLACHQGDRLVAIAALERKRRRGIFRLGIAGADELFEPADLLWSGEEALQQLVRALARCGTPWVLERVATDSPSLDAFRRAARGHGVVFERPRGPCPFIALDESWREPEQHLNPGRRSDLRRARRKAQGIGPVRTEVLVPSLDELPRLLDVCFDVEARSWKGDAGTALTHDTQRAAFYRQYAHAAANDGVLRICLLHIGDHVAAMQLAVQQGRGFWLLKVGYDAEFAASSPGNLLMRDTIRHAVDQGLASYEFLGRADAWTRVWTQTERAHVSLRFYPLSLPGIAALSADGTRVAVREWQRRHPR